MIPKARTIPELSRAVASDFEVPTPEGLALFPYQRAGVEFATRVRNMLLADPPGVGKTIQVIGYMNATDTRRVLVL
jgi:SWI/SNF-related matrix-associated actin-dependent regulator 1 of chromatin subfamily A